MKAFTTAWYTYALARGKVLLGGPIFKELAINQHSVVFQTVTAVVS